MLLHDLGSRVWPVIPTQVIGPDWVSGGEFFIRNRRQPNIYWWVHNACVRPSEQRRTKFHIQRSAASMRDPVIMIREDKVTVRAIPQTVTPAEVENYSMFISVGGTTGNALQLNNVQWEWTFGLLLNKDVGVRWENGPLEQANELLVHMPNGGGDEWELV
jgi:hypothetical protein